MSSYFVNFPRIKYFNTVAKNITLRAGFVKKLKEDSSAFYPYQIGEGERADTVAAMYYDNPDFDWLVYLANDIVDPYTQWPKSQQEFNDYIVKKYGSQQAARSQVAFYRKNPDIAYVKNDGTDYSTSATSDGTYTISVTNEDIRITADTYALISDKSNYYPVYAYDYEIELNEEKRNIVLIDEDYANRTWMQLRDLLNG